MADRGEKPIDSQSSNDHKVWLSNIRFTATQNHIKIRLVRKSDISRRPRIEFSWSHSKLKKIDLDHVISLETSNTDPKGATTLSLLCLLNKSYKEFRVSAKVKDKSFKTEDKSRLYELRLDFYDDDNIQRFVEFLTGNGVSCGSSNKNSAKYKPLKFLNFICEKSGKGQSRAYFDNFVLPILKAFQPNIEILNNVTTEYIGHAEKYIIEKFSSSSSNPEEKPDVILVMSGDGILNELLNGFHGVGADLSEVKYFHFPTGSGNGVCCSRIFSEEKEANKKAEGVFEVKNVTTKSLLRLVRQVKLHLLGHDLNSEAEKFSLMQVKGSRMAQPKVACISLSWGFVADCDKESESLRVLGDSRFFIYGLIRTLFTRRYYGRFSVTKMSGEVLTFEKQIFIFLAAMISNLTSSMCLNVDQQFKDPHSLNLYLVDGDTSKLDIVKFMLGFAEQQISKPAYVIEDCRKIRLEVLGDPSKGGRVKEGLLMTDGEIIPGLEPKLGEYVEMEIIDQKMLVL